MKTKESRANFVQLVIASSAAVALLTFGCDRGVLTVSDDPGTGHGGSGGSAGGGAGGKGGAGGALVDGGSVGAMATCTYVGIAGAPGQGEAGAGGSGAVDAGASDASASNGQGCPCSRRPGSNNSFKCPVGTGVVASGEFGPEGGSLILGGTPSTVGVSFKLDIPPNALSQRQTISVTELSNAPSAPYIDESPVFDIQPAGLTFSSPATLTVPFMNVDGVISPELSIYASSDCQTFQRLPDSYSNAGFLQASMRVVGPVFAGYPRTEADIAACAAVDASAP